MENAVLFFDDFAFVFDGISDCLFVEKKGEKTAEGVEISCVRDCNGERILKNARKQTQSVCSEAEAVAMKSPVRKLFCGHTQKKNCGIIAYYGIKHGF